MIIYNVTVKVDTDVHLEWLRWMKEVHIPNVMNTGMFVEYSIRKIIEQDETDGVTFAIQYLCNSIADYQTYSDKFAAALQQEHWDKYKDKVVAFRTLMEVIS